MLTFQTFPSALNPTVVDLRQLSLVSSHAEWHPSVHCLSSGRRALVRFKELATEKKDNPPDPAWPTSKGGQLGPRGGLEGCVWGGGVTDCVKGGHLPPEVVTDCCFLSIFFCKQVRARVTSTSPPCVVVVMEVPDALNEVSGRSGARIIVQVNDGV